MRVPAPGRRDAQGAEYRPGECTAGTYAVLPTLPSGVIELVVRRFECLNERCPAVTWARVRCWAGGGRLVWRRGQRPGRRSHSVSRRGPGGVLSSAARGAIDAVRAFACSTGIRWEHWRCLACRRPYCFGDCSFAEVLWLAGRALTWSGKPPTSPPVAFVAVGFQAWEEPELFSDALVAHRGLVVDPARPRPRRPAPQVESLAVAEVVVLIVFCLRLPETKAARPGRPAFGRRAWGSVPSMCNVTLSASA